MVDLCAQDNMCEHVNTPSAEESGYDRVPNAVKGSSIFRAVDNFVEHWVLDGSARPS